MSTNHNRNMGNSGHYFEKQMDYMKQIPTEKQRKFFHNLLHKCWKAGLEPDERPGTRSQYAESIKRLIKLLEDNGVEVKHNNKQFVTVAELVESQSTIRGDSMRIKQKYVDSITDN